MRSVLATGVCLALDQRLNDIINDNRQKSYHVAIVYKGKSILKVGYNKYDRQYFQRNIITSMHAECDCLRQIRNFRKGLKFLVIKVSCGKDGEPILKNSAPCSYCKQYLMEKGFRNIYHSTGNGFEVVKINLKEWAGYKSMAQLKKEERDGCPWFR